MLISCKNVVSSGSIGSESNTAATTLGASRTCPPRLTTCGAGGENAGNGVASGGGGAASPATSGAREQPSTVSTRQDHVVTGFTGDVLHRARRRHQWTKMTRSTVQALLNNRFDRRAIAPGTVGWIYEYTN